MYQMMYYGGLVSSIIIFLLLILIFVQKKIYRIISDLSGLSAKKSIRQIEHTGREKRLKTPKKEVHVRSGDTTQKLAQAEKTTMLEINQTEETTVLENNHIFEIVTDIMEIHSNEVI